jgi:hypothetical protein
MSGPLAVAESGRGQANLAALVVGLGLLLSVTVVGVAVAEDALADEQRPSERRHVAFSLSERLIEADSPIAHRANVLNATTLASITPAALERTYPVLGEREVTVAVGGNLLVDEYDSGPATTARRLVLVERVQPRTITPAFSGANAVTLSRRTDQVRLALAPTASRIERVRVNERIVLANASGLRGNYTVDVSRRETVRLSFVANASLSEGDVTVRTYPTETTKTQLVVTVGD